MEKEKIEKDEYELVKVPTGEALAIQRPNGEVFTSIDAAIVEILNLVKDIAKAIK